MSLHPLVEFLVAQPTATARLLAQHTDDGRGYCRGCSCSQGGRPKWPCTIHHYATEAAAYGVERRRDPLRQRST